MREYHLIEASKVIQVVARAYVQFPRFHDLYDGFTWRLCRDPLPEEAVEIAPETFLVKSVSWSYPGFCVISLVYTVDEPQETITVVDMWVDEPDEE